MVTRTERVAEAQRLRSDGLRLREIGERMGAATQTVHAWLSDPDGSRLKARKDSYRGSCEDCGAPTDGSNGASNAPRYCRTCQGRHNPRTPGRVENVLEMVRLRVDLGLTNTQIAEQLGIPVKTVSTELHRMRVLGFAVPLDRYAIAKGRHVRAAARDLPCNALERALSERGIRPPEREVRDAA